MNLLAHALLSGPSPDVMIGGLVGDHARTLQGYVLPARIQRGIDLHQAIDEFVDDHPAFRRSVARFNGRYRHVGGIIVDLCYDHCLAVNWATYSNVPLPTFVHYVYGIVRGRRSTFPLQVRQFIDVMIEGDWLNSYYEINGLEAALTRIESRLRRPLAVEEIMSDIQNMYEDLEGDFTSLFPAVVAYSEQSLLMEMES